jgi:hypothetical protein
VAGVDPVFQPYYNTFYLTYNINPRVPIGLKSLVFPIGGECNSFSDGGKEIAVDSTFWTNASDLGREQLVFHELGHCIFGRLHNRMTLPDGCPKSIMNPYNFSDACYSAHRTEYLQELPYYEPGDAL